MENKPRVCLNCVYVKADMCILCLDYPMSLGQGASVTFNTLGAGLLLGALYCESHFVEIGG